MKNHVTFQSVADELLNGGWGRENVGGVNAEIKAIPFDGLCMPLLLDIAKNMRRMVRILECHNFQQIPMRLKTIEKNTRKRKRVKNAKAN